MVVEVITKFLSKFPNRKVLIILPSRFTLCSNGIARQFSAEVERKVLENNVPVDKIRNFCIIAHVDHGKSTLADRFLEIMGGIKISKENQQFLDRLPVEKERGITVKSVCASLPYRYNNTTYLLNLIDTPGHVDFSSEVGRSLFACQGVILLVDAKQGVQAQTIANFYLAFTKELTIIPVLNKIDLPQVDLDSVEKELEVIFGFSKSEILRISAKTGQNVEELLKTIIEKVPPPPVSRDKPFKALLIDSWFEKYRGALLFIYVAGGVVKTGDRIVSHKKKDSYEVKLTARLTPEEVEVDSLLAGQVGVIACNMKKTDDAIIGDTLHDASVEVEPLQSFDSSHPKVFAGIYPRDQSEHGELKSAIAKLCLNDPAVTVALEASPALGSGWRLGFLGLLHLDVFRQRLEQEFKVEAILTAPAVTYKIKIKGQKNIKRHGGDIIEIQNPVFYPTDSSVIEESFEPIILGTIITPVNYFQDVIDECLSRRGQQESVTPLDSNRIMLKFVMPLSEIIYDFHDKLKRLSSGYASFDYEDRGYASAQLQKITVLLNGREVEELTTVVHESKAKETGLKICSKLEELIPRQQVQVNIQASVGSKIIARKTLKAVRKDVTAKLYGGDVTRKMKLLRFQKEGKKKMRKFFNLEIERDTFINVLKER